MPQEQCCFPTLDRMKKAIAICETRACQPLPRINQDRVGKPTAIEEMANGKFSILDILIGLCEAYYIGQVGNSNILAQVSKNRVA